MKSLRSSTPWGKGIISERRPSSGAVLLQSPAQFSFPHFNPVSVTFWCMMTFSITAVNRVQLCLVDVYLTWPFLAQFMSNALNVFKPQRWCQICEYYRRWGRCGMPCHWSRVSSHFKTSIELLLIFFVLAYSNNRLFLAPSLRLLGLLMSLKSTSRAMWRIYHGMIRREMLSK